MGSKPGKRLGLSLLSRNSPRKTRERRAQKDREQSRVGEKQTPTLGPVVEKIPEPTKDIQQEMLDKYSYTPEPEPKMEPVQLNRAILKPEPEPEQKPGPEPTPSSNVKQTFGLYDLSFFCEERIYISLFRFQDLKELRVKRINIDSIRKRLEVYAEYSKEVRVGAFKDILYFYKGEVLIPEEYINISGFMRKFLDVERVHILFETGEILSRETEYCNFWLKRITKFFEPVDLPLDKPKILDEEICLDCNLKCIFRYRQQMIN